MARYQVLYSTGSGTQLSDVHTTEFDWVMEEGFGDVRRLGRWYFMQATQPPKTFLIHESCWFLLVQQFEGEDIDLDRLFEVCKEIPPSGRGDLLAHGGSLQMRYRFHPSKRPIIKGLQEAAKQFPKMPNTANNSDSKSSVVLHPDGFGNLPIEIRLQIATYLPTVDFLSLRQSSRAMVVIFEFQSFWKSRFSVNGDRGVLNCLLTDPRKHESRDWRLIYRCTANIDRSHEHLWAAQRLWRNNRWLRERYSMIRASNEQIFSNLGLFDELCRKEVSSGLRCDRDGLKLKKMEEFSIVGLGVSIIREGTETYVAGLDLLNTDPKRPNLILGYRLPGQSVTINLYGEQLIGFAAIVGEAGIHAIRPIFNKNITTSWIGLPNGREISTTTMVLGQGIRAISGKFDPTAHAVYICEYFNELIHLI
ncbi:Cyclin-like F-box [Penicillium camemberti]|uniref:Cyclin-like F-box n=1 Tax=Penicillium camemberti (strain FM 013) TaxID=1429867 RepID=A0A0G4PRJ4_PENC3|nr:Cyclin-like F-box [Penicillium camemberti]